MSPSHAAGQAGPRGDRGSDAASPAAAEYVIVGGGVMERLSDGALQARGAGVLVLEAQPEVAGGASAGIGQRGIRSNGRSEVELPIGRRALELWPEIACALEPRAFDRRGGVTSSRRTQARRKRLHWEKRQNRAGIDTRIVRGDELYELEPNLSHSIAAAVHCPKDGVSDHTATTRALAAATARAGGMVRTRARATGLHVAGQRVVGIELEGSERVEVRTMALLFANASTNALLEPATGQRISQAVVAPQALVTAPLPKRITPHLVEHVSGASPGRRSTASAS